MPKKYIAGLAVVAATALALTGCGGGAASTSSSSGGAGGTVTLEFAQWWEPELPAGALRSIMDDFEAKNAGIKVKLISGPYAATKQTVVAAAASGTMSDVVGLDGAWVSDFVKQGALANVSQLMSDAKYDDSQLAAQIKLNGNTYMIPVANFVYPLFVNTDLLTKAGVTSVPTTRTEFAAAATALTKLGNNTSGWVLPLSTENPNGIQNDVMSWVWASGASMLKDGKPDVTNSDVKSAATYIKSLYDAKVISPGSFTMQEQDKVNEFTNGRVGMMIDSLAHVGLIRKNNPNLKFAVAAIPAVDGFSGQRGLPYASWGIGIAANSKHQAEAFKLVQYLMSQDVNAKISSLAHGFPGNKTSTPDYVSSDAIYKAAFDIYKSGTPANEFTGLPVAEQLMRDFDDQFQLYLDGKQSVDDALTKAQTAWVKDFAG